MPRAMPLTMEMPREAKLALSAFVVVMPDTDGDWATTRFVDPADLRHDMHVTIVTLQPGGSSIRNATAFA